ncbi:MAG TPA: hypothetical protein VFR94_01295 [Nitrososphaeraceae archaeon]|nr:hypothetical protein [Nitrososphaeraceae archaeon]
MLREGGVLFGEGQGIITAKDGQGVVTWTGQGIGKFTGPGKVSFRGSIFLRTPSTSQGGKLSELKTWWECLNTKQMRWEIALLKVGSGNRIGEKHL